MTFPDSFFQGEYRSDFYVCEMMKHAWAAKLELLEIITNICKKHHIQYFACGGTLLGAVRHQGFIPWDDDIDIGLKRPDYNRLVQILPQELPYGIFLAGIYGTDHSSGFLKCDQSVVVTNASQWNLADFYKKFHGFPYRQIGIDIYPYDYIPRDAELSNIQKYLIRKIIVLVRDWKALQEKHLLEERISEIEQLCNVSLTWNDTLQWQLLHLSDTICSLYTEADGDEIANYPTWSSSPREHMMKKEWYDTIVEIPFENTTISVPQNYHEVLSTCFEDYKTPTKGTSLHNYPFYASQEKSLKSYLKAHGFTGSIDDFCKTYLDPK